MGNLDATLRTKLQAVAADAAFRAMVALQDEDIPVSVQGAQALAAQIGRHACETAEQGGEAVLVEIHRYTVVSEYLFRKGLEDLDTAFYICGHGVAKGYQAIYEELFSEATEPGKEQGFL